MNKKVKLPKFMCMWLEVRQLATSYPISLIGNINKVRANNDDVAKWLAFNKSNQWLLIDALHYGYEAEPEPRWGIKAGHSYLYEPNDKSFGPDEEPFAYDLREQAEEVVARLGFGEVVDLNKEG